jgi:hypothetical protein
MKDLITRLSRLAGKPVTFGSFDPSLFYGASQSIAPSVAEYFRCCIPNSRLDLELCIIFSATDLDAENLENVPSCFCSCHGFVTIGTSLSGDAFSVDVTDGRVYHLSHEKYESDGIHPGWNAECTYFLPALPVNRQNIIATSEGHWESIAEFLDECLRHATANG